jgi:uncharacterized protein YfaS (alpha-2-macroglobulin family)
VKSVTFLHPTVVKYFNLKKKCMRRFWIYILFTLCCVCFGFPAVLWSQQKQSTMSFTSEWKKADSLLEKGFPESATTIAKRILDKARSAKDEPNTIKAQLFLLSAKDNFDERASEATIDSLEQFIAESKGVARAVWQSIAAQKYWNYYQDHRWSILERSIVTQTTSTDISTWDARRFYNKIADLYSASLSNTAALQQLRVEDYLPLIVVGVNSRKLRPTLYDVLVFAAIDFFSNDEKELDRAADHFQIQGAFWFSPYNQFKEVKIKVADPDALHFKALQYYQAVIQFHSNDASPEALIDADLNRLQFVHQYSVHPQKDSLYLAALFHLAEQFKGNSASAQVSHLYAAQQYSLSNTQASRVNAYVKPRNGVMLTRIKADFEKIIATYPKSEGALNAQQLLRDINQIQLNVQIEAVNIPEEHIKFLVTYKNISTTTFKLYKVSPSVWSHDNDEVFRKNIDKLTPLRTWSVALPGSEDLQEHRVELKLEALGSGRYILMANNETSDSKSAIMLSLSRFQVSNIAYVQDQHGDNKAYALHRNTGYPLSGTEVYFYKQEYNQKLRKYDLKLLGKTQTSAQGVFDIKSNNKDYNNRVSKILLVKDKDSLEISGYFYNYPNHKNEEVAKRTFLFTDRAIYRPGQTIYFKGILLRSSNGNRDNVVIPNESVTVFLRNANGEKVAETKLTTNAMGSYTGTFQAPESGLMGAMSIVDDHGSVDFNVEEYKRPKFYVDFDALTQQYQVNENVSVKGFAQAYAGNNIDGAMVKYRVVRKVNFPYYWCYYYWGMPNAQQVTIAEGTTITDAKGTYQIDFTALPDLTIPAASMPVFRYEIWADVIDVNGETRSSSTVVRVGYHSLILDMLVPERIDPKKVSDFTLLTKNLNDVPVNAMVSVTVQRLQNPGFFKKRLWQKPDQSVMTETEYRQAFPDDEYDNESDYRYWKPTTILWEKTINTANEKIVKVPSSIWQENGWYLLTLNSTDAQGKQVVEKKYTYVWYPEKKGLTPMPLVLDADQDTYQPGETLQLWYGTAIPQPYLLRKATRNVPDQNPITIKFTESDRGGLVFAAMYVYKNRTYMAQNSVSIPWNNKDLKISWATHRDKLLPGANETWSFTIEGNQKEKFASEMVATLYDASLDAYKKHHFNYAKLFPTVNYINLWDAQKGFNTVTSNSAFLRNPETNYEYYQKDYDVLWVGHSARRMYFANSMSPRMREKNSANYKLLFVDDVQAEEQVSDAAAGLAPGVEVDKKESFNNAPLDNPESEESLVENKVGVRSNLNETAFFLPQLHTDEAGNIRFSFTMPEALTSWNLMAFSHTADWETGYLQGAIKTQKELMVTPNLPRFLRQNDDIIITTKVSNLNTETLSGYAKIQILDAQTLQPLLLPFGVAHVEQNFTVAGKQSTVVSWKLHVPESRYDPVIIRIVAQAGDYTDGEEQMLPVVTNRILVTETLPMPMRGSGSSTFTLNRLFNNKSSSLVHRSLTVEYTSNPAWYAVQALPYLMEYPYECAEQTFNRFYANALAQYIVKKSPRIAQVFEQWNTKDTAALLSNLEKNQELKSALLAETPWVFEAKTEQEQKKRMALLFQAHSLSKGLKKNATQLEAMLLPEGAFPWFKGMSSNRVITQYIALGMARLQHLGVTTPTEFKHIIDKVSPYLDQAIYEDYETLLKHKIDLKQQNISALQLQYLYWSSFNVSRSINPTYKKAFEYYKQQAAQHWHKFSAAEKGMAALILNRYGNKNEAANIITSLKQTAIQHEELGMYWESVKGYWWYQAPIENQALLIEAFEEVAQEPSTTAALKVWLLKQKQTQAWPTTKGTADAIYALLLQGNDWLSSTPNVSIQLGNTNLSNQELKTESGTSYFSKKIEGKAVTNDMGKVQVTVKANTTSPDQPSWGAVYWQYFEDIQKVEATYTTPLAIQKELYKVQNTPKGETLVLVSKEQPLQVGDKVKVRMVVKVDRAMEYVHLKDNRAACFEPVAVLSQYQYQQGLGYYESTKDLSTNYFFDYLNKGTHVFEYVVTVNHKGTFSSGMATAQCMYAPEFSSHTAGGLVVVP